jgi:hypothetical protein
MLINNRVMIVAMAFVAVGPATIAAAEAIELPCTLDKYTQMSTTLVDRNYTLIGGLPDYVPLGYPLSATLYKFDISALTEPVQSASLVVDRIANKMAGASDTNPLTVHAVSLTSDVAGWTALDTSKFGDVLDSVTFTSAFGLHTFDVTSLVNDWISGAADNNGIALMVTVNSFIAPDKAAYVTLAGVTDPVFYPDSLGAAPVITTTVPEPATMGLLAMGGLATVLRRRRKG